MSINIELKVVSPEIEALLLSMAEVFENKGAIKDLKAKETKMTEEIEAVESQPKAIHTEIKPSLGLEDVRKILASKAIEGHQEKVLELLKKYGGNKITQVPKENYEALLEEVEAI